MNYSTLSIKETGLMLIDMQDGFIRDDKEILKIIPNQIILLRFCIEHSIPIFVILCKRYGELNDDLSKEVAQVPLDLLYKIQKPDDSAFYKTELNDILNSKGIKNLLLAGINAGACVKSTASDAVTNGYRIITSKTLIGDVCHCSKHRSKVDLSYYEESGICVKNHYSIVRLMDPEYKVKDRTRNTMTFLLNYIKNFLFSKYYSFSRA